MTMTIIIRPAQADEDIGEQFSNALISDLAPLVALFGEQITKQFMSQSMYWSDHIILAMLPLGILTSIVGAIRLGGPTFLKALIGRARESRAAAEVELMSSTSHDVCEVWNGRQIVRVMGSSPVRQILYFPTIDWNSGKGELDEGNKNRGLYTLQNAATFGLLKKVPSRSCPPQSMT